jgi:hypothetical protein
MNGVDNTLYFHHPNPYVQVPKLPARYFNQKTLSSTAVSITDAQDPTPATVPCPTVPLHHQASKQQAPDSHYFSGSEQEAYKVYTPDTLVLQAVDSCLRMKVELWRRRRVGSRHDLVGVVGVGGCSYLCLLVLREGRSPLSGADLGVAAIVMSCRTFAVGVVLGGSMVAGRLFQSRSRRLILGGFACGLGEVLGMGLGMGREVGG